MSTANRKAGVHGGGLTEAGAGSAQTDFMTQFLASERRIRAFARALVARPDDAEDVFQQAAVTMLEKFDPRNHEIDFTRWACRIVLFKVMELKQKQRRDRLRFSDRTLTAIARDAVELIERVTDERIALERCLQRLRPELREMIVARYERGESIDAIAGSMGRTVQAVYRALSRSRRLLHDCITESLQQLETST